MEEKYRELSADYYKRKQHLFKKRLKFLFILFSSVSFLLFLSISEGYALILLLSKNFSFIEISVILILISIYLLAYNIILSKIYLHICYYFENKKTPSLIIMTIFIILYLVIIMSPNHWGPPTWSLFHTLIEKLKEEKYDKIYMEL